ncbi:MAG TPA: TM2 domain-containing protein [Mycobacterium sp.]|nr:TM2 domain-containing protein [Mycobacterium sp.]
MSVPPPPYGSDPPYLPPPDSDPSLPPPVGSYDAPPPPPPGPYGSPPPYGGYPPPYPAGPFGVDAYGRPLSDKSKLVAGLLQLFLGTFGIGRFYLGYTGLGVAMLLLSWLTCGIWPLIDAILILVGRVPDSDGRTLRD